MPPLAVTRLAINIVSSLGVAKVVGDIVKNNTTVLTTSQKVLVNVGGLVLGSMVIDNACKYVNDQIDAVIDWRKEKEEKESPIDLTGSHRMPAPETEK